MGQVKQVLAERDARLSRYHLVAETNEGEQQATHAFFFRSPNHLRAVMLAPVQFEWNFDGKQLRKLDNATKTLTTFEMKLPPTKAAAFLHATFSPFVLEGFRTPLLPAKGVWARRVVHPQAPQAVELRIEPGEGVTVTYVLRWPTGDFIERRSHSSTGSRALTVEDEQCDVRLKLCVPKVVVDSTDAIERARVRLTQIELNLEVPADDFAPALPTGWKGEARQLVEE